MQPIIFIADLHLSDEAPDLNALLWAVLAKWRGKAQALYILGDLFEAWTGDDDNSLTAKQVAESLKDFSQTAPIYFIAGNRDFLVGENFARLSGMTILPEQYGLKYRDFNILLTHGDEMCTQDLAYLRYRKIMRNPMVQYFLLKLPFEMRQKMAQNMRHQSRLYQQKIGHRTPISDVTEDGIRSACLKFPKTQIMIHGHTHRPAIHQHIIENNENNENKKIMRYVLPDWHDGRGGWLRLDDTGFHLEECYLDSENKLLNIHEIN